MRLITFITVFALIAGCKCHWPEFRKNASSILLHVEQRDSVRFSKMMAQSRITDGDFFYQQLAAIGEHHKECKEKLMKRYGKEYGQLLKTAALYDRTWQQVDASGYSRLQCLNDEITCLDSRIKRVAADLKQIPYQEPDTIGMAETIARNMANNQYQNEHYIRQIDLEIDKLELMQEKALIELKIPIKQSDIIQMRALFLQNLEALKTKLD